MQKNNKAASLLKIIGIVLISCVFTLSIGYYIGDRGLRWFPTTVEVLLICLFAGICCLLAVTFMSGALRTTTKGKRLKKRVFFLLLILSIIGTIHLISLQIQKQTPLTSLTPEAFETMVSAHLEQLEMYDREMESLLQQIQTHPTFTKNKDLPLAADEERFLRESWLSLYDYAFALEQIRQFYQDWYYFDVSRPQRPYHVQSYLLTFGADVILYDKALRIINTIKQNPNAVKFLNTPHPDSTVGPDSFSRFQLDLFGADCHTRICSGQLYTEWLDKGLKARSTSYSGACAPLWQTIESRLAILNQMDNIERGKTVVDADFELIRKGVSRVWFPAQKGVAEWMGDTRLQRVGKYLITPQLQEELNALLEPGDILLSRKNWYLSNVGLPGFWPHAILYVGNPEKLAAHFDDPAVSDYLKTICGKETSFEQFMSEQFPQQWLKYQAGNGTSDYHVIEAIKYGVLLNPLSRACGDYMVALRPKLDKVAKTQAIIEAFSHLDKPYDFNFDFATDHALVCTELVWRSYRPDKDKNGLNFELVEIAGRKTLPANEIARLYSEEKQNDKSQFDFICFIDASEKEEKADFSDEKAFLESVNRQKWSFLQN